MSSTYAYVLGVRYAVWLVNRQQSDFARLAYKSKFIFKHKNLKETSIQ
jgi:hypothetical protein